MSEMIEEAIPVIVNMQCESCYSETMERDYDSPVLATYPPKYTHICNNCGCVCTYPKSYPYTKLVPKKEYVKFISEYLRTNKI